MSELISRLKEIIEKYNAGCYNETCNPFESCTDCVLKQIREVIESQPSADQWIPCSSGRLPENGRTVPITTEYISGCRHITSASYHTKKGILDDYEWTGEGFYQYDSEYGYGRLDGVVAWLNVEPYKGDKHEHD